MRKAGQTRRRPVRRLWSMAESKPLSWQFDDAAQLCDEVRSRYPEEIIEHIIAFAALLRPCPRPVGSRHCATPRQSLDNPPDEAATMADQRQQRGTPRDARDTA